jgi:hypothetical protein
MVRAVAALHSCRPTISAPELRIASMQRVRLVPPFTHMLKLMTLRSVTGLAETQKTDSKKSSPPDRRNNGSI